MAVLMQSTWFSEVAIEVNAMVCPLLIVIVPPSVATVQLFPVVVMAYVNGEPVVVVGVPDIVKVVPATEAVTPVGKPVTFAPVAPPPNV